MRARIRDTRDESRRDGQLHHGETLVEVELALASSAPSAIATGVGLLYYMSVPLARSMAACGSPFGSAATS